jgi:protein-S-isoprenylcysteine O-methyltransferase Ste14
MIERDLKASPSEAATTFPWPPLLFVFSIALPWFLTIVAPLPWPGLNDTPASVVGVAFGSFGILLVGSALWTLRSQHTTYLPHRPATALVTSGPYRRFRNPIYLGEVLLLLYGAQITQSIWFVGAALLFVGLVTALQIIPEERHLEATFGEEYLAYKARSRRWI